MAILQEEMLDLTKKKIYVVDEEEEEDKSAEGQNFDHLFDN
jgi:hypothetical protein